MKMTLPFFSGAVAVGSKGGLRVPGEVWDVTVAVWEVTVSKWSVTTSTWSVTASMHDVQLLWGMLHPQCWLLQHMCMMYRRYVGC